MLPIDGGVVPTKGLMSFMYYRGLKEGMDHYHRGVDIAAPLGKPVKAAEGGIVEHAVDSYTPGFAGYGKVVVIHGENTGVHYLYAHMSSINVSKGKKVSTGEQIGRVGYTAYSSSNPTGDLANRAAHLHFEAAENKYPMAREATRLDPVAQLRLTPGMAAAGAGIGLVLLGVGIGTALWLAVRRKPSR